MEHVSQHLWGPQGQSVGCEAEALAPEPRAPEPNDAEARCHMARARESAANRRKRVATGEVFMEESGEGETHGQMEMACQTRRLADYT